MKTSHELRFPESALSISFQQATRHTWDRSVDDLSHRKTVPYAIIVRPLAGWYTVTCSGKTVDALPGSTILVPANTEVTFVHHIGDAGTMQAHWLHIAWVLHGAIDFTSLLEPPLIVWDRESRAFGALVTELTRLAHDAGAPAAIRRKELGFTALRLLLDCSQVKDNSADFMRNSERLIPVLSYMRAHLSDEMSVTDLAGVACLSPSRFLAYFKSAMSVSPMAYVRKLRIEKASGILMTTDKPIGFVAAECGFVNQFHFSRVFRDYMGISPKEYRARLF